jgi:hypothetical protein
MSGLITQKGIQKLGSNDAPTQKVGFSGLEISKLGSTPRFLQYKEPQKQLAPGQQSFEEQMIEQQEQIGAQEQNQLAVGGV